jgi:hypothetical protein
VETVEGETERREREECGDCRGGDREKRERGVWRLEGRRREERERRPDTLSPPTTRGRLIHSFVSLSFVHGKKTNWEDLEGFCMEAWSKITPNVFSNS